MISFIIVACSKWQDYATPFIASILAQGEPGVEIILVDNGSPIPYEASPDFWGVRLEPEEQYNYMRALNIGAMRARGDWLIFCNDDILCRGKFSDEIESLSPGALYGLEIRRKDRRWGLIVEYIYGWMLIVPRKAWEEVGPFDEQYLHAGFDDIDYCWRAQQKRFALRMVELPFIHLADQPGGRHRRVDVPGFRENMARSKRHFLKKVL